MRNLILATLLLSSAVPLSGVATAAEKIEFEPIPGFLQVPPEITLGPCSAVAIDDRGEIYLFHRGKSPIIRFTPEGKFVRAWGDDLISRPHGIRIDPDRNVWVSCTGHHVVLKYSPEGKLLLALGTPDKPGDGVDQFNRPADMAFGADGEVYVADGYGNARVIVFDRRGAFLRTWGKKGSEPGEFNLPHAIRIDPKGRILVADRENKRIQLFDREGKLLEIWTGIAPYGLEFDRQGNLFMADPLAQQIFQLDSNGKIVHRWGEKGLEPGKFDGCHMLGSNPQGDLFIAEVEGKRTLKWRRK